MLKCPSLSSLQRTATWGCSSEVVLSPCTSQTNGGKATASTTRWRFQTTSSSSSGCILLTEKLLSLVDQGWVNETLDCMRKWKPVDGYIYGLKKKLLCSLIWKLQLSYFSTSPLLLSLFCKIQFWTLHNTIGFWFVKLQTAEVCGANFIFYELSCKNPPLKLSIWILWVLARWFCLFLNCSVDQLRLPRPWLPLQPLPAAHRGDCVLQCLRSGAVQHGGAAAETLPGPQRWCQMVSRRPTDHVCPQIIDPICTVFYSIHKMFACRVRAQLLSNVLHNQPSSMYTCWLCAQASLKDFPFTSCVCST